MTSGISKASRFSVSGGRNRCIQQMAYFVPNRCHTPKSLFGHLGPLEGGVMGVFAHYSEHRIERTWLFAQNRASLAGTISAISCPY
jgi:hypothetical protein